MSLLGRIRFSFILWTSYGVFGRDTTCGAIGAVGAAENCGAIGAAENCEAIWVSSSGW